MRGRILVEGFGVREDEIIVKDDVIKMVR